jgi:cAMP phosphodiesterase
MMEIEQIHYKKVAVAVIKTDNKVTVALFGSNSIELMRNVNALKVNGVPVEELSVSEIAIALYKTDDDNLKLLYTAAILLNNFKLNTARIRNTKSKQEYENCLDVYYDFCKVFNEITDGNELSEFDVSYIISELILSIENQSDEFFNNFSLN